MRPFGSVTKEHIKKEVDAVITICNTGGHENIIKILGQGTLPWLGYYYIDMEYCDINLEDYIHGRRGFKSLKRPFPQKWTIMTQIARGLNFLHKGHYVHRDLKPRNSNVSISSSLIDSPFQSWDEAMETHRLWYHVSSHVQKYDHDRKRQGNSGISGTRTNELCKRIYK
jgi:serine/threonine protein kinase